MKLKRQKFPSFKTLSFVFCLQILIALLFSPLRSGLLAQEEGDEDVVRVSTELVVLNVTVLDAGGNYIHGLKRSDFKLFEDGGEQTIKQFTTEETPFAAAILLDISGSMDIGKRMTIARSAAIRFLDGLREEDVAGVYTFHTKVEQVQEYSHSRDLRDIIFGTRAEGMTKLNDAILQAAKDLSERLEKRRAIIVLSDGADTYSKASADKALSAALAAHATIYTVDMSVAGTPSAKVGPGALKNFASKSGGRYVATPGGQALRDAFAAIVEELSNQYTISYQPTNRARDGRWREIEVKLSRPELSARTRKGYRIPKD